MFQRWAMRVTCLTLAAGLTPAGGASSDVASQPAAGPHAVMLSADVFPEGVGSEDEYRRFLTDTTERLAREADAAESPRSRIEANLTLANWLLARRIEPAASRVLLDIDETEDSRALADASGAAIERLGAAADSIERYQPADPDEPDQLLRDWTETLETLRAFSECFAALGLPDGQASSTARRHAAARLAAYLDDPRRDIATPARLWQAALLLRAGQPDRSARLLEPALSPIVEPVPGFFTRLLRVRATLAAAPQTDVGRHATAMALILRLEERCESVFESPDQAAAAETTCSWTRWRIGRQWIDSLEAAGNVRAAERVRQLTDRIHRERLSKDEPVVLLRIGRTIPMLIGGDRITPPAAASEPAPTPAEPPEAQEPEPDAETKPADER